MNIKFVWTPQEMPLVLTQPQGRRGSSTAVHDVPRKGEMVTFVDDDGEDCTGRVTDVRHAYRRHIDKNLHLSDPRHITETHHITVQLS